jgi:hypothetical protein
MMRQSCGISKLKTLERLQRARLLNEINFFMRSSGTQAKTLIKLCKQDNHDCLAIAAHWIFNLASSDRFSMQPEVTLVRQISLTLIYRYRYSP